MPKRRIPTFIDRLETLCAEAGLPRFDETSYEPIQDILLFLWHEPEFCLAAPLGTASIYGMQADDLRGAWERKFGVGHGGPRAPR